MRNRFKGLDLIERGPDELWMEVRDIVGRQRSRLSPWKRNAKKQNGVWGGLTNSCEKKRSKKQRRKGKIYHLNAEFQRIARKPSSVINEKK